jgi:hypothetical protein
MFIKDIDPARLALLSPEQLKVVERWDREAKARTELIPELCQFHTEEERQKLAEKLRAIEVEYCEHGRHKSSASCHGCEEIENIIFPELMEDE